MGLTSKAISLFLFAGSLSTVAAGSWPTPTSTSSSSSSSSSTLSTWSTSPSTSTSTTTYLATITPCPWCPSSVAPAVQNVTQQLQTLSTCSAATSACYKGKCHTSYPYSSWQWVSTTIPCSFNNFNKSAATDTGSSCLVTKTEDCVPVSEFTTTLTSYTLTTWTTTIYTTVPVSTASAGSTTWVYPPSTASAVATTVSEVVEVIASPVPVYEYVEKDYCAVFSGLGPLAMLDHYDGSGLCTTCGVKGVGLTQAVSATECRTGYGFTATSCVTYVETWISKPAPPATLTATQVWSSNFYTSGSWDITFTGIVPAQTISAPNGWVTSDPTPVPWAFHGSCSDGPTTVDFTTTVTTTVTVSVPWATHTDPYNGGWGDWTVTSSSADPTWTTTGTATSACSKTTATGYIKVVDLAMKYRKRDSNYVAFSGEDGIVVSGKADATTFVYDGGYLLSGSEYITGDGTGYSTFEKSSTKPSDATWFINGCGEYGPLLSGSDSFCESPLGSLFIEYDSTPSFTCPQVWLQFVPLSGPTSSPVWPTSTTSTSSTTSTTSTTPTPDPSSDPDMPGAPAVTPMARVRRAHVQRQAHSYRG